MSLWRGQNLGIVFQFFQLLPMISLLDNVVLPMDLCNIYSATEREERAFNLLRLVNLERFFPVAASRDPPVGSNKALRSLAPWRMTHLS